MREIPDEELRVELFRPPNPNGIVIDIDQGVRLTHIPTGLQAESRGERSQLQNKAVALAELRRKLEENDHAILKGAAMSVNRDNEMLRKAMEIGREHGRSAWAEAEQEITGGHVSALRARANAEALIAGIEGGDPEILNALPQADLSGSDADGYTEVRLASDVGLDMSEEMASYFLSEELCGYYEDGFNEAVEKEAERSARSLLAPE